MSIENGPSEAEQIKMQSEAEDTNKMVDEGLLMPEEASEFDYQNEMEIPKTWLKESPKITERLREHVVSKYPAEYFQSKKEPSKENDMAQMVHGTSFDVIYPLWMGTGQSRTGEYGIYKNPSMSNLSYPTRAKREKREEDKSKGIFMLRGELGRIGKFSFSPDPETGRREISESDFPVNIIVTSPNNRTPFETSAMLLAKWESRSIEYKITFLQEQVKKIQEKDRYAQKPNYVFKDLARKAKEIMKTPEIRDQYINDLIVSRELNLDKEQIQTNSNLTAAVFGRLKSDLSDEDKIKYIQDHIEYLKDLKKRHKDEKLYDWAKFGSDRERIFTVQQVANYAANVMVQGVDKSKIVPIYDWDGNLLWPTEEDVIKSEEKVEE